MKLMNKSIVTICAYAALTTTAYAENPTVTFYGLVDLYAGSIKTEGSGSGTLKVDPSGMTTSFFGTKATYQISDDLTAVASLEGFLRPDIGDSGRFGTDTFFARNAYVGLSGSFGTVQVGRNTTPYFISVITTNPFGGSFGFGPSIKHSFLGGLQGDSGWSNSVYYGNSIGDSIKASLLYSAGEVTGQNSASKIGASAFYSGGALSGTLAYQTVDTIADNPAASPSDNQTAFLLGAAYDFGNVKGFAQFQKLETEVAATTTEERETFQIGASIPVDEDSKVLIAAATTDITGATNSDRKTFAIAYDTFITPKIDLYAVLFSDDSSAVAGKATSVAGGARFRF